MGNTLFFNQEGIPCSVPVISYREDPKHSFHHKQNTDGIRRYGFNKFNPDLRKTAVNKVVLHHDGTNTSDLCYRVLVGRQLSTHILIDVDGTVYQPLNLAYVAFHAAGVNPASIGIDLNNPCRPKRQTERHMEREIFSGRINGGRLVSLGYTDAQYDSLIAVLQALVKFFPNLPGQIPIGPDGKVVDRKLQSFDSFAGIVAHYHVSANKWDPGPGFDWERVVTGIRGRQLYYPATLPDTQNLSEIPKGSSERVQALAETYFQQIEQGEGGYFPVGVNQAWHTGVHLPVPLGTPVKAPSAGKVLVARNMERDRLGSPNFVLIKHEKRFGRRDIVFYTLLMHLRKQPISMQSEVPWIKKLLQQPKDRTRLPDYHDDGRSKSAPGLYALETDRVALIEVEVEAGEIVGHSDAFAGVPDGEMMPLVDLGMFSNRPLVGKNDPTFEIVDEDPHEDILCNARAVWRRLGRRGEELRGLAEGGYPLSPTEIQQAYGQGEKSRELRYLIIQHVTEWHDKTDFAGMFGGGTEYEWQTRKRARIWRDQYKNYLWWDTGVTVHTGLNKEGLIYAHHPIALLTEMAFQEARDAFQPGEDGAVKGFDDDQLRAERRRERELEALTRENTGQGSDVCSIREFDDQAVNNELLFGEDENPEDEAWMRWEQGEWLPEEE